MSISPWGAPRPPRGLVILGHPVQHSLSPVFQNAALQAAGFAVTYERRDVPAASLASALQVCREADIAGNVTMPHKEAVFRLAERVSPVAQRTGAVNTFWWDGGALVGHNTDVDGVMATVRALCSPAFAGEIVVLGAGGSAAAVLVALRELTDRPAVREAPLTIVARNTERAVRLLQQVGVEARVVSEVGAVRWERAALVINATPLGMQPADPLPVPPATLAAGTAVFDLVYRRDGTAWVHAARAAGLTAEDGLRMLVEQGAAAFTCWFGTSPSRQVMWTSLGLSEPDPHTARA